MGKSHLGKAQRFPDVAKSLLIVVSDGLISRDARQQTARPNLAYSAPHRSSLTLNLRARSWKAPSPPSKMSQTAFLMSAFSRPPD
jgi:hypothetical protein